MTKIDFVKKATRFVVSVGVGKIVSNIIANNVEIEKPHQLVTVHVAGLAIGGAVAEASGKYTDSLIDEIVDAFDAIKATAQK